MFDNTEISGGKECRPNYEEAAARLKKRIDADRGFLNAFAVFSLQGSFSSIRDNDRQPFYAMFGELSLRLPGMDSEYANLLTKIEDK